MKSYYVYVLTNRSMTLYIGVTNDLDRRLIEHREKVTKGFTEKYSLDILVYFEETDDIDSAIEREKQLKKWSRAKKIALIETLNPGWIDLSTTVEMTEKNLLNRKLI